MSDFFSPGKALSAAELDRRLEKLVFEQERSEKLIFVYLYQFDRRKLFAQCPFVE